MAIKNLTDRYKVALDTDPRGRPVRLGTLQKGEKKGHGRNIQLFDRDYLIFRPAEEKNAATMQQIFTDAYGAEPREIPDVRIPVSVAGNFSIEDCAWLTAGKHTENGSMFLARSDGEWILQARDPQTGKVKYYEPGEMSFDKVSKEDDKGRPCYPYGRSLYPWQRSMAIDLVLPKFNDLLYRAKVTGHGVVTLITHSTYDISQLIGEYYTVLNEWAALMANPINQAEQITARHNAPLRNIPLRLYRSIDHVTTPDYRKGQDGRPADPGNRLNSTRSLLHWQTASNFAAAMQQASDTRTALFIDWVANRPILQLPAGERVDQINADLFGDPRPKQQHQLSATAGSLVWQEWAEGDTTIIDGDEDGVYDEQPIRPGNDPGPMDWRQQTLDAKTLDGFASALYQLHPNDFANAQAARKYYLNTIGQYDPANNEEALENIEAELALEIPFGNEEAQEPPAQPQRPVAAEKQANGGTSNGNGKSVKQATGEPSGNAWNGEVKGDWREKIAKNQKPTVGTVVSAVALACSYYKNEDHALNSLDGYNKSDKLTTGDAVSLFDQLIERARQKMTAVPA